MDEAGAEPAAVGATRLDDGRYRCWRQRERHPAAAAARLQGHGQTTDAARPERDAPARGGHRLRTREELGVARDDGRHAPAPAAKARIRDVSPGPPVRVRPGD